MLHKKKLQKKTWAKRTFQTRSIDSHLKAFANIEHQLKNAYHTLKSHAKPNVNMYMFARDTQKVMLLLAELRYLINECKIAQNRHIGKSKNKKRRRRAA